VVNGAGYNVRQQQRGMTGRTREAIWDVVKNGDQAQDSLSLLTSQYA